MQRSRPYPHLAPLVLMLVTLTVMASATAIRAEAQTKSTSSAASSTNTQKIVPIDLNTADAKALAAVRGVGDKLAADIIKARPFKSVDDLKNIKGIGAGKKFDALKPYFMVAAAAADTGQPATSGTPVKTSTGKSTTAPASASRLAPGEKININTATAEQLDKLPDIGAVKAKAIIDYRTKNGAFSRIEDVMKVKGIKAGTFAKIKDSIVVR